MRCLRRIVNLTWGLLTPGDDEVLLLHVPSGHVLTHGPDLVRFPSASAAQAFLDRYLDEAPAWETLPAEQLVDRAA